MPLNGQVDGRIHRCPVYGFVCLFLDWQCPAGVLSHLVCMSKFCAQPSVLMPSCHIWSAMLLILLNIDAARARGGGDGGPPAFLWPLLRMDPPLCFPVFLVCVTCGTPTLVISGLLCLPISVWYFCLSLSLFLCLILPFSFSLSLAQSPFLSHSVFLYCLSVASLYCRCLSSCPVVHFDFDFWLFSFQTLSSTCHLFSSTSYLTLVPSPCSSF